MPVSYFFDDELSAHLETELEVVAAMRDEDVRRLAARATGLSPTSLGALLGLVETLRNLEGLPQE